MTIQKIRDIRYTLLIKAPLLGIKYLYLYICLGIQELCLLSFIGIELALGIYFPAIGTLRGFLVPENQRYYNNSI